MDLAVTAWLESTVPPELEILDPTCGLPPLPPFAITLRGPPKHASSACRELGQALRDGYSRAGSA